MKKFGIIVILLLVLTAGGIGAAHFVINGQRNDVTITETTLAGDRSQADGIFVKAKYEDVRNTVNWVTTYSMTEEKVIQCDMDMENNEWPENEPGITLQIDFPDYSNTGYEGDSFDGSLDEITAYYGVPKEELLAAKNDAEAGKMTTTTYPLADYLDYVPVTFQIRQFPTNYNLETYIDVNGNVLDYDYFKMPVPKGAKANLKVTKNASDETTFWHFHLENPYYYTEADGVFHENALYLATSGFCMSGDTLLEHIVDMPDETRGIHYIPLALKDHTYYTNLQAAKLVYPLDPGEAVLRLKKGIAGDTLLLYTEKQNTLHLTIIDIDTMECRQEIRLMKNTSKIFEVYQGNNYILTLADNGDFNLLDTTNKEYQIKLRGNVIENIPGNMESLDAAFYDSAACATDYDGQRLAFASFESDIEGGVKPTYLLQVFDENGLTYMGRLQSSLTNETESHNIGVSLYSQPIDISFDGFDD